jgi:DnaJ-class molecular chaperone
MELDSSKNYYELLGVERDASLEEIKSAYKELARLYHPDSNFYDEIVDTGVSAEGMAVFKILTHAYHTLANSERRKAYDSTIAPALPSWDTETEIFPRTPSNGTSNGRPETRRVSEAYGIFGTAKEYAKPPQVDEALERELDTQSAIIRRKMHRRSIVSRLLKFVGL